ncbi:hypothetical protein CONPUDRAFT_156976 [Coniophora puteana RWD-64-598 SS2]|uniref:Uncharacterized protein n=1 Tax=Coniophora puteana (strain RWD-64-598) TaxID=741705 RepID=A0A5M3MEZ6_CONPW|nr:uncharacterized protein CONPUDRAFT_156976 [Coniophora puteana RWD-64-598 SS2]EIW77792.1 hypothetical protein CONPUDRAFT_156976 [Coniophora puteana RWD-64-598 SS2]
MILIPPPPIDFAIDTIDHHKKRHKIRQYTKLKATEWSDLQKTIRPFTRTLDRTRPLADQRLEDLRRIKAYALQRLGFLTRYVNAWPVFYYLFIHFADHARHRKERSKVILNNYHGGDLSLLRHLEGQIGPNPQPAPAPSIVSSLERERDHVIIDRRLLDFLRRQCGVDLTTHVHAFVRLGIRTLSDLDHGIFHEDPQFLPTFIRKHKKSFGMTAYERDMFRAACRSRKERQI